MPARWRCPRAAPLVPAPCDAPAGGACRPWLPRRVCDRRCEPIAQERTRPIGFSSDAYRRASPRPVCDPRILLAPRWRPVEPHSPTPFGSPGPTRIDALRKATSHVPLPGGRPETTAGSAGIPPCHSARARLCDPPVSLDRLGSPSGSRCRSGSRCPSGPVSPIAHSNRLAPHRRAGRRSAVLWTARDPYRRRSPHEAIPVIPARPCSYLQSFVARWNHLVLSSRRVHRGPASMPVAAPRHRILAGAANQRGCAVP